MSNGNIKTAMKRTPVEWSDLIDEVIKKIEENGYPEKLKEPEIIRLLVHFRPARSELDNAFAKIVQGFQGIQKVNPEVEKWMKGKSKNYSPIILKEDMEREDLEAMKIGVENE